MAERWSGRLATARVMVALCYARLLVTYVPFGRWRGGLGYSALAGADLGEVRRLARLVEHAAARLPFEMHCLPRAMTLSWMLRSRRIGHVLVLAARPAAMRDSADALHAWVEIDGSKVIGDLPGPWLETLRLGERQEGSNIGPSR